MLSNGIINRMSFDISDYNMDIIELFKDISFQIKLLTKNKNACTVYELQDKKGTYILEYSSLINENEPKPYWLFTDEIDSIAINRTKTIKEYYNNLKENELFANEDDDETNLENFIDKKNKA